VRSVGRVLVERRDIKINFEKNKWECHVDLRHVGKGRVVCDKEFRRFCSVTGW
jgi:hypothetical protein